jgi:hypothetical protein
MTVDGKEGAGAQPVSCADAQSLDERMGRGVLATDSGSRRVTGENKAL